MSCIAKIKEASNSFTPTEKKIEKYLLENPAIAIKMNAKELADEVHTSPSAIIRFSQRLGYKGFTAMKVDMAMNDLKPQEELYNVLIDENDSTEVLIQKLSRISVKNIQDTYELINHDSLHQAIECLLQARTIYLVGFGGSGMVCDDFMQKLLRIHKNVVYNRDRHVQYINFAFMDEQDVLVAVSYSGKNKDVNNAVHLANEKHTPVVAITQFNTKSPLAKIADINLYTPVVGEELRLGAISSRDASLIYTDLLFYGIFKENIVESKAQIVKTRDCIDKLLKH